MAGILYFILCAVFFLSGACGLIYEITWLRVMGLVFGNTTYATSTVLAGYMAGLGLGALYFGKWVDRKGNPVRIYAWLEGGVGLYALLTPFIWKLIEFVSIQFYRSFQLPFLGMSLFKLAVAFLALFVPTFLMGGTLPVISKFFARDPKFIARDVGFLYALNTFGAVIGVFLSGFFLLYTFGVWQTAVSTGIINLSIFGICFWLSRNKKFAGVESKTFRTTPTPNQPTLASSVNPSKKFWNTLLVLFGISGGVSMMYEIGWTRVLAIVLGSSVYAFSVMLATFLIGIALGSFLFGLLGQRIHFGLFAFGVFQFLTAFFALVGLNRFENIPFDFVKAFEKTGGNVWLMECFKFMASSSVMLAPTILIGAMFACFIHIFEEKQTMGERVGKAYFANTIGTIAGSVLTGFVILPLIGIQNTLILASILNAVVGLMVLILNRASLGLFHRIAGVCLILLVFGGWRAVHPWDKATITAGTAVQPYLMRGQSKKMFHRVIAERQTLFYKEGVSATVNVTSLKDNISLAINGKTDASNDRDIFTQYLLGHLPMLLHPNAKDVLVIGLGSASTVGAVTAYPVEKIHCVELEKAVVKASDFFKDVNHNALADKRVQLFIDDGRNFLLARPNRYDVIISEPSNPWMAGVGNLFSHEHYQTMAKRLKPGGIVCQWLHAYSMSLDDFKMIVNTFALSFQNVSLWTSYYPDLMLIGSNETRPIDFENIRRGYNNPIVFHDLSVHGMTTPASLFSNYWLGDQDLRIACQTKRINSDNKPYLEFSAPRYLYVTNVETIFKYLNAFVKRPTPDMTHLDPPLAKNADFLAGLARGYIAKNLLQNARLAIEYANRIDANRPQVLEVSGILHFSLGNYKNAQSELAVVTAKNPKSKEAFYYSGFASQRLEEYQKAIEAFQNAIKLDPKNDSYLISLGDCYMEAGLNQMAINTYKQVIQQKGTDFYTLKKIAELAFKIEDFQELFDATSRLIRHYPGSSFAYECLGRTYEGMGRYRDAIELYNSLLTYLPEDPDIYLVLARLYDSLGQTKMSNQMIRKAIRYKPSLRDNQELQALLKRKT